MIKVVNTVKTGRTGIPVQFPLKELGSRHSILSKKAEQTVKSTTPLASARGRMDTGQTAAPKTREKTRDTGLQPPGAHPGSVRGRKT